MAPPTPRWRRRMRLRWKDYREPGPYFITICTEGRVPLFGEVHDGVMRLNRLGELVHDQWHRLSAWNPWVQLDAFEVMPNHIHGIIGIGLDDQDGAGPRPHLGTVVNRFKALTATAINEERGTPGAAVWQRGYYEHFIRNGRAWQAIREYILANPAAWGRDRDNPFGRPRPD